MKGKSRSALVSAITDALNRRLDAVQGVALLSILDPTERSEARGALAELLTIVRTLAPILDGRQPEVIEKRCPECAHDLMPDNDHADWCSGRFGTLS